MCGIVGYVGEGQTKGILLDGLSRLEYRGYDSAGVALLHEGRLRTRRAKGKLVGLAAKLRFDEEPATTGIGHTRWATHGGPSEANAHPHRAGTVAVVHNGIIENHGALRRELEARGRVFGSDTDTEVLAHLIDEALACSDPCADHPLVVATRSALARVEGTYALLVVSENFENTIVAAREASPLVIGLADNEMFASSDVAPLLSHTRDFIYLEDGDIAQLSPDGVEVWASGRNRVERPTQRISWDPIAAEKQGYKHFMLKEIHEQPARISDTLRGRISGDGDDVTFDQLDALLPPEQIAAFDHVQIIACGTSFHAGLVGRGFVQEFSRVRTSVDLGSEYRYGGMIVNDKTLAIAISQSGETADTLAAMKTARDGGATVVSICNVLDASIPRSSDAVLYTHAGPEIGVASTKAFTTQLAVLYLFAVWLGLRRGTTTSPEAAQHLGALRAVPGQIEALLDRDSDVLHQLARGFRNTSSCLYLGRGAQHAIAVEGALKLKEISYIHAEGYAAGEMKHGPIALIDETVPVVVIAPSASPTYSKVLSNLEEVRARGGRIIAVATEHDDAIETHCEAVLRIPDAPRWVLPFLTVVPLQLLAYAVADTLGTDVDQPRNLAKSVTVE